MHYWLMKSEPDVFSIHDLKAANRAPWDGVRSYQARNNIDRMRPGDLFLFYHSSCRPPGLAGIGEIVSEPYPDRTALDPDSLYHDSRATAEKLPWKAVDVCFREAFDQLLSLEMIRTLAGLEGLALLKKASRLSVMPVTAAQLHRLLPVIALVLFALGAWLAWSGWQQQQGHAGSQALQHARDGVAQQATAALSAVREQFRAQLATPAVQSALAAGDLAAAGAALGEGVEGIEGAEVAPLDLDGIYAAVAGGDATYGKLAAMEAAVVADAVVASVIRDEGKPVLAVSAPARTEQGLVGVAYARLPLDRLTAAITAKRA